MLAEGRVGELRSSSGATRETRLGSYSELICNDTGFGRYFEAARLGRSFLTNVVAFAQVAANATALAATTQFIVGFSNPIGSGKAAVITRASEQTRSGTPAGPLYLTGGVTSAAISSAATGTVVNTSFGAGSAMIARNNVALTGFVVTGNTFQVPIGGPAAVAAGAGVYSSDIEFAGQIIIPPGGVCGILGSGVGTSHVVDCAMYWVEVDWPL